MNKIDTKYERLSAYLDDELNLSEKTKIEEELSSNVELQNKLRELKRLKGLAASVKRISEAPFFETRLMENIRTREKTSSFKLRKWIPAIGLVLTTFALMAVLKFNPQLIESLLEQQKSNLTDFYKANLQPFLFSSELDKEDIFNFAFYRKLPLDKQRNQYLQLGYEPSGSEFLEINYAGMSQPTNNYENFVRQLDMNDKDKELMDSILNSYADDLPTQILVNDKNVVAISPNLWNYSKAIAADLLSFAANTNKTELTKLIPVSYNFNESPQIRRVVTEVKTNPENKYIFITPDTIFSESFEFDREKFKSDMQKMKEELNRAEKEIAKIDIQIRIDSNVVRLRKHPHISQKFKIQMDTNFCRIHIPKIDMPDIQMPDFDSLASVIEEATKQFQVFSFNFKPPKMPKGEFKFRVNIGDSLKSFDFNWKKLDSLKAFNWKNMPLPPDSFASYFKFFFDDSTFYFNNDRFQMQMKDFEKEMQRLKEEMQRLKDDMNRENKKIRRKENKTIEI